VAVSPRGVRRQEQTVACLVERLLEALELRAVASWVEREAAYPQNRMPHARAGGIALRCSGHRPI